MHIRDSLMSTQRGTGNFHTKVQPEIAGRQCGKGWNLLRRTVRPYIVLYRGIRTQHQSMTPVIRLYWIGDLNNPSQVIVK
jgi:hypothetical protein